LGFWPFHFRRQRRKRRARYLKTLLVSLTIHQALAVRAVDCRQRAVNVAASPRDPAIVTEIKFDEVPVRRLVKARTVVLLGHARTTAGNAGRGTLKYVW
jgi:hypothetical protein